MNASRNKAIPTSKLNFLVPSLKSVGTLIALIIKESLGYINYYIHQQYYYYYYYFKKAYILRLDAIKMHIKVFNYGLRFNKMACLKWRLSKMEPEYWLGESVMFIAFHVNEELRC